MRGEKKLTKKFFLCKKGEGKNKKFSFSFVAIYLYIYLFLFILIATLKVLTGKKNFILLLYKKGMDEKGMG